MFLADGSTGWAWRMGLQDAGCEAQGAGCRVRGAVCGVQGAGRKAKSHRVPPFRSRAARRNSVDSVRWFNFLWHVIPIASEDKLALGEVSEEDVNIIQVLAYRGGPT